MIRNALIPFAGILAATCFACVQIPPAPPPSGQAHLTDATCSSDGSTFISHVFLLSDNWNPGPGGGSKPPSAPYTGTGPVRDDLNTAFANAPPWSQNHLCSLTGIYLNPASGSQIFNDSWGFRKKKGASGEETYVGISLGLWTNGTGAAAEPLAAYENAILQDYADWDAIPNPPPGTPGKPTILSAIPNTSWMTVLAALAHEVGHVRWAKTNIPTAGGSHDFTKLQKCSSGDFFADWFYQSTKQLEPPGRWRSYKNRRNNDPNPFHRLEHAREPFLWQLSNSSPTYDNQELYQLYQSDQPGTPPVQQGWASLFGAQTPDEDFVETYVMAVLTGYNPHPQIGQPNFTGPLTALPVMIPNQLQVDIPADLVAGKKAELKRKMDCISAADSSRVK
jgi:hypothetical protein